MTRTIGHGPNMSCNGDNEAIGPAGDIRAKLIGWGRWSSDPERLNGFLVSLIDRFQRQMLVDLQALLAFVA
jgi:hypothetical protein